MHVRNLLLHGVGDFCRAKVFAAKVIWALVLVGSWSFAIRGSYEVIMSYQQTPTSISMTTIWPDSMPEVTFCPVFFADRGKMEQVGIHQEMYEFLNCFLPISQLATNSCTDTEKNEKSLDRMQGILSKHNISFATLMGFISRPASDVMEIASPNWTHGIEQIVNAKGVCYVAKINETLDMFSLMSLTIYLKLYPLEPAYEWPAVQAPFQGDKLYIGEHGLGLYPMPEIPILRNHFHYSVKIVGKKVVRLPGLSGGFCSESTTLARQFSCIYSCMNDEFEAKNSCSLFNPEEHQPIHHICSPFARKREETMANYKIFFAECFQKCKTPCTTWHYQYAAVTAGILANKSEPSYISIGFENPFSTFKHVEENSYSFDRFVSDIGGQLSLWSGASLVSLFQLAYLIVNNAWDGTQRRKRVKDEKPRKTISTSSTVSVK